MLHTGVLPGEALGLRWEFVDFDRQVVTIRHQASRDGKRTALKTTVSEREVPMCRRLRRH